VDLTVRMGSNPIPGAITLGLFYEIEQKLSPQSVLVNIWSTYTEMKQ
jgi:hypothetical protein